MRPVFDFKRDEMRDHAQHVVGVARDHVVPGHPRLKAERRALDRWRDAGRADVGQHVGDIDGVLGAFLAAPIRLVNLLLHLVALEMPVDEGIGGVDVHIIVIEKFLQLGALGRAVGERFRRACREPDADAERLVAGDPRLHLRQIGGERMVELLPVVGRVHQRRIGQMAETVTEIHCFVPVLVSRHPEVRAQRASKGDSNQVGYSRLGTKYLEIGKPISIGTRADSSFETHLRCAPQDDGIITVPFRPSPNPRRAR